MLVSLSVMAFTLLFFFHHSPLDETSLSLLRASQAHLFLVSAAILFLHGYLYITGSRSLKRGVKHMRDPLKPEGGISVFGWKRPDSEQKRLRGFWQVRFVVDLI